MKWRAVKEVVHPEIVCCNVWECLKQGDSINATVPMMKEVDIVRR